MAFQLNLKTTLASLIALALLASLAITIYANQTACPQVTGNPASSWQRDDYSLQLPAGWHLISCAPTPFGQSSSHLAELVNGQLHQPWWSTITFSKTVNRDWASQQTADLAIVEQPQSALDLESMQAQAQASGAQTEIVDISGQAVLLEERPAGQNATLHTASFIINNQEVHIALIINTKNTTSEDQKQLTQQFQTLVHSLKIN